MAQSGGVTRGEDQSTGQLGLRLRRVLILFKDNRAGISRLCPIAEDPADTAILLELVRTRAPNRQRIRIHKKTPWIFHIVDLLRKRPTNLHRKNCRKRLPLQGLRRALTKIQRGNATGPSKLMASRILRRHFWGGRFRSSSEEDLKRR